MAMVFKKEWHKLLLVLGVLLALVVADRIVGSLFEYAYRHSKYGIFNRQEYCMTESKDKVLILGSSRAAHHYVPSVIEDSLGLSCYNCGSDGMCVYYHYSLLSAYVSRGCVPDVVIYDLLPQDVQDSHSSMLCLDAAIDRLAPDYGRFPVVDSLIELNGWKETLKLKSLCYRYNSKLVQLLKCNFIPSPEDKGYEALTGEFVPTPIAVDPVAEELEPGKVDCMNKLVAMCKDNGIKLFFSLSPSFNRSKSLGLDYMVNLSAKENIPLLDHMNDEMFLNTTCFKDSIHLNDYGARMYTELLTSDLKRLMNK